MRLDRLLSDMGLLTRSEARAACKSGQVLVDGVALRDSSAHVDPERQSIVFRGRDITYRRYTYVMLNKPEGYVSATEDSKLPVVTELLDDELRRMELFPVGRLDRDTTGLMILTNNGPLAHRVLSPKHHVPKLYRFTAAEPMAEGVEELFRYGVTLADGYECKSAIIELDEDRMGGYITLTEGKYHQIKRMVASTHNRVVTLERVCFGEIALDTSLGRGEYRFLTDEEIATLEKQN